MGIFSFFLELFEVSSEIFGNLKESFDMIGSLAHLLQPKQLLFGVLQCECLYQRSPYIWVSLVEFVYNWKYILIPLIISISLKQSLWLLYYSLTTILLWCKYKRSKLMYAFMWLCFRWKRRAMNHLWCSLKNRYSNFSWFEGERNIRKLCW